MDEEIVPLPQVGASEFELLQAIIQLQRLVVELRTEIQSLKEA